MAEILLAVAAALLGAVLVVTAGAPLVDRLARVRLRRRVHHDTYDPRRRPAAPASTVRAPLDLGPDPSRWPSEIDRGRPWREALRWPSESWDDATFGHNRATAAAEAARRATEAARERAQQAQVHRATRVLHAPLGTTGPDQDHGLQPPPGPPADPTAWQPPDAEAIRALVRERGLPGAVRELAARSGRSVEQVTELLLRRR